MILKEIRAGGRRYVPFGSLSAYQRTLSHELYPRVYLVHPSKVNCCSVGNLEEYETVRRCQHFQSQMAIEGYSSFLDWPLFIPGLLAEYGIDCCKNCYIHDSKGYCELYVDKVALRERLQMKKGHD